MTLNRKHFLSVFLGIATLLLTAVVGGSFYLVDYALVSVPRERDGNLSKARHDFPELQSWTDSLQSVGALRDTFVVMPTGERAHALYVKSPSGSARTAVLVHGYGNNATSMLQIGRIYHKYMHCNILLPDLHGHGRSQGDDIQMGWKDRQDVLQWIDHVPSIFRLSKDSVRLVVHGISMGAATTMCVSGEQTPHYVKCFVEDCGYTSVWDEFSHELKGRFSLPDFPLLYTASWIVEARYGWCFKEASPLKQVAKCHKPMLFIHGDNDTFVPSEMVYPLYEAKPQPKELWIARGSKHAAAYGDHREEYIERIVRFVGKYMGK